MHSSQVQTLSLSQTRSRHIHAPSRLHDRSHAQQRLLLEALESRQLLSTVTFATSDYFPMGPGNSWVYDGTYKQNADLYNVSDTKTRSAYNSAGITVTRFTEALTFAGSTSTASTFHDYTLNTFGLKLWGFNTPNATVSFDTPLKILNYTTFVGDVVRWTNAALSSTFNFNGINGTGTGTETGTSTVVAQETVALTGGQTVSAYKILVDHTQTYTGSAAGQTGTVRAHIVETFWLAQAIGVVKFAGNMDFTLTTPVSDPTYLAVNQEFTLTKSNLLVNLPTKLTFVQPPTNQLLYQAFNPPITVQLQNNNGTTVTGEASAVTLAIVTGPAGSTLWGTTTVQAVNGVATFTSLSLDIPGTYTLRATSGSLTAATSPAFSISTTPIYTPITHHYQDALLRSPDATGMATWAAGLKNGTVTPTQMASGFINSTEYLTRRIQEAYQTILDRPADTAGFNSWLAYLTSGHTLEQMTASFYGSSEYYLLKGSTNTSVVTAYYYDILGRAPDAAGLASWVNLLNTGTSRTSVAYSIMTGNVEGATRIVTLCYTTFLHRQPDPNGLQYWVNQVLHGTSELTINIALMSSSEYYYRS